MDNNIPLDSSNKNRAWLINRIEKLIAPSKALTIPRHQAEARLISALLLPSIIITGLGMIVSWTGYLSYENLLLEWVLIITVIGYIFSKTRYYLAGGLLLLVNGSTYAFYQSYHWSFDPQSLMHPLFWLVATVMLGGFWLRPKLIILLGISEVGLIIAVTSVSKSLDFIMLKEFLPFFVVTISLVTVSTVIRDNDKKKIEEQAIELKKSEEYLNNIIHSMHDSLITMDEMGLISMVNPSALTLLGYEASELIGMPGALLMESEETLLVDSATGQKEKLKPHQNVEKTFLTKSGEPVPVMLSSSPMLKEDGNTMGMVMVAKDMTDIKRLEAQLRQSQKMEAMGTLAGGIAHEFNNMLGTMTGYVKMMLKKKLDRQKMTRYLEAVRSEGLKAAELIEQILTFSRVEKKGRIPLKMPLIVIETFGIVWLISARAAF